MGFLKVLVRELQTKPWLHGFGKRVVEPKPETPDVTVKESAVDAPKQNGLLLQS
jgi:hypothetical protein